MKSLIKFFFTLFVIPCISLGQQKTLKTELLVQIVNINDNSINEIIFGLEKKHNLKIEGYCSGQNVFLITSEDANINEKKIENIIQSIQEDAIVRLKVGTFNDIYKICPELRKKTGTRK